MKMRPLSRRCFLQGLGAAMPLVAAGCSSLRGSAASSGEFVTIRNRRFERRGRPYFFIGANFSRALMLANPRVPGGRERLVRELDQLRSVGITNLRLIAGSEGPRGILASPGQWNEQALQGLDFVLAEMARRDMTGVLYLTNYWSWSGGMAQYVNWATGDPIPDPNAPGVKHTGADHMKFAARFYGLPRAQELFREHIEHVLNRRNTVNERVYHSDPAIMSWQLSNEPRPGTDEPETASNLPAFHAWMEETARFIKDRAPRQLVSTGSEGIMGCIGRSDVFLKAHESRAVDYATLHVWVKNWGWLKEPRLGPQYEEAAAKALRHIQDHVALAEQLGKPLVMEEFGISRDEQSTAPGSPTTMRDDYFGKMFECLLDSCSQGRALAGVNFWSWGGSPRTGTAGRGGRLDLNDVMANDASTLSLIGHYNAKLARIERANRS